MDINIIMLIIENPFQPSYWSVYYWSTSIRTVGDRDRDKRLDIATESSMKLYAVFSSQKLGQPIIVLDEHHTMYAYSCKQTFKLEIIFPFEIHREKVQHATGRRERHIWIMRYTYYKKDFSEDVQSWMGYCHIAKFVYRE